MDKKRKSRLLQRRISFLVSQQGQTLHYTRILCNQNQKSTVHKHKCNKLFSLSNSRFRYNKSLIIITFFYLSGSPDTNKHFFYLSSSPDTNKHEQTHETPPFPPTSRNIRLPTILKYRTTVISLFKTIFK